MAIVLGFSAIWATTGFLFKIGMSLASAMSHIARNLKLKGFRSWWPNIRKDEKRGKELRKKRGIKMCKNHSQPVAY